MVLQIFSLKYGIANVSPVKYSSTDLGLYSVKYRVENPYLLNSRLELYSNAGTEKLARLAKFFQNTLRIWPKDYKL
jgi:hypothetical protein